MRSAVFAAASAGASPTPRRRTSSSPSPQSAAAAVPSSKATSATRRVASSSPSTPLASSSSSSSSPRQPAPPSSTVVAVRHVHEYRRNVGICLVNASGKVFAARRTDDTHGSWQMPQGGIDHLENPLAAAARELREETGIVSARVVAISRCWHVHDSPTRVADPLRPGEPGALLSYRGQTQKWVLMYYYGDRDEVDLGPEATREFSEWGWRDLAEVAANVVPFKRRAYEAVAREFGPVIAARARRRRRTGRSGGSEWEGEEDDGDDDESLRGWWGLSLGHHQKAAQAQQMHQASSSSSSRRLQSQILPASGVAMKAKEKEKSEQRQ